MTGPLGGDSVQAHTPTSPRLGALSWSAIASLLSGLGALGFLTLGRFVVGLEEFAPMSHTWIVWSVAAATVGFGAQIETVDSLRRSRGALSPRHLKMAILGSGIALITAFIWRADLFESTDLFWPIMCGIIPVGSLATGISRGALAARDERRRLAGVIAGENLIRLGGAAVLWWWGLAEARYLAVMLLAGFVVALITLPDLSGRSIDGGGATSIGGPGAFAGLVAHLTLVLPPSILALRGSEPEIVSGVFLVLTYMRAPYQLMLGMSPVLTAQSFAGVLDGRIRWLFDSRKFGRVAAVVILAAGVVGFSVGDFVSVLILGRSDVVSPVDYALLASLVATVGIAIFRTLHVLGAGHTSAVNRAWGVSALVSMTGVVLTESTTGLGVTLLVGAIAGLALLTAK